MTANQIYKILEDAGVSPANIDIDDENYQLPSLDWISGEFAAIHAKFKKAWGENTFIPVVNDCDDFSDLAKVCAQKLHKDMNPKGTALAFGTFKYQRDNGEIHRLNVAIVEGGKLAFYEPQICQVVPLSEWEIILCQKARI